MLSPDQMKATASDVRPPTVSDVVEAACAAAFGNQLITNSYRGLIAETIVHLALSPGWRWCSADYWAWDFEHADGTRLEVRQSAARQTWSRSGGPNSNCRFDIRERAGRYDGAIWLDGPGRFAHIYVFAYHHVASEQADHRQTEQWRFYVVPTTRLPSAKSIGLIAVGQLASPVEFDALQAEVERIRIAPPR